jgi:hypothetical protein
MGGFAYIVVGTILVAYMSYTVVGTIFDRQIGDLPHLTRRLPLTVIKHCVLQCIVLVK